eukprot:tig00021462_g21597.t1
MDEDPTRTILVVGLDDDVDRSPLTIMAHAESDDQPPPPAPPAALAAAAAAAGPAMAAACAAFCPRLVLSHCRGARLRGTCHAVAALLDLAGFSDLVQRAGAGESDMEQVFDAINSCFRAEIDLLEGPPAPPGPALAPRPPPPPPPLPPPSPPALALARASPPAEYGADVLSFLGDGLLAIWPVEPYEAGSGAGAERLPCVAEEELEGDSDDEEGRLASALALRAAAAAECALRVQERFAAGVAGGMRLRVALAAGPLRLHVGGIGGPAPPDGRPASLLRISESHGQLQEGPPQAGLRNPDGSPVPGRMVFFVKGAAVTEAGDALADIAPGQVCLCPSLLEHIPRSALVVPTRSMRREASRREVLQREAAGKSARRLSGHPTALLAGASSASFSMSLSGPGAEALGATTLTGSRSARLGSRSKSTADLQLPTATASGSSRALPLVVDPSAGTPLADYCRTVLGVPSGSLAGRLREPAPPLETPEQLALASLFVRARLDQIAGLGAVDPARYLAEFRPVSVLFGSLELRGEGDEAAEGAGPRAVQRAVRTVQALLYAHEGSLRQIVLDDKGLVVIGVFGLYPISHEDDTGRCAACALDVREAMEAAGVGCALGLATGPAFCAFVGDPATRCEFSVFGNAVNRAARLMGKAGLSGAGILADGETRAAADLQVEMEAAGEFNLKGIPGPTAAFRPLRVRARRSRAPSAALAQAPGGSSTGAMPSSRSSAASSRPAAAPPPDLPRSRTAWGAAAAGVAVAGGRGGDTGLGKSALARAAAAMAAAAGWRTAATAALATERQPLAAWRPLLAALFPQGILEARPARAARRPAARPGPHVAKRRPSLQWISGPQPAAEPAAVGAAGAADPPHDQRRLPRNRSLRTGAKQPLPALPAEARAAQLRAALRLTGAPHADVHLADSQSQAALLRLAEEAAESPAARLLLLVTGRPPATAGAAPAASTAGPELEGADLLEKLSRVPERRWLDLLPLNVETISRLACARLGAASLPPQAAAFIAYESGGVPFIAADLADRLRVEGTLQVDPATGACTVARPLRNPRPSDGLRSALLWRLDRLAPSQLFAIASIVGNRFSAEEVASVLPQLEGASAKGERATSGPALRKAAEALAADFAALCAAGVLREAVYEAAGGEFEFALSPLREVVRGLLPVAERRRLHRAFAEFLDREARDREPAAGAPAAGRRGSVDLGSDGASASTSFLASSSELVLEGTTAERLAYHWTAAEEPAAALPYLDRCAAAALGSFANVEAEHAYGDLLAGYPGAPALQRAGWLAGLAEVCLRSGRYPLAAKRCREALALLGVRIPTSRVGVWASVMYMAVRTRLRAPPTFTTVPAEKLVAPHSARGGDAAAAAVADLYVVLRQAAAHGDDIPLFLYCGFALWAHVRERSTVGPHFFAIASALVASNIALMFPGSRALATAYAKFGFELGSDACVGTYSGVMHRAVAFALVATGEFGEGGPACDLYADAALRMARRPRPSPLPFSQ